LQSNANFGAFAADPCPRPKYGINDLEASLNFRFGVLDGSGGQQAMGLEEAAQP
jgi:hypothetical protein